MKVKHKYDSSKHSQVEHFINDVKYATISLNSEYQKILSEYDDEILSIDILPIKERFANDYETLFQMLNYKLHTNEMVLQKKEFTTLVNDYVEKLDFVMDKMNLLAQLQVKHQKKFLLHSMSRIRDLMEFHVRFLEQVSPIVPSLYWLELEHYDEIRTFIDETQTRVEDLYRARKRILKVWNPAILDETYEEVIEEFQKVQEDNLKFLSTSFWKTRKQLRRLFIEDIVLLNEQEYKTLYHNRKIVKANETWLANEQETIQMIFGKTYLEEKTKFEEIRQDYEELYSFLVDYDRIDLKHLVNLIGKIFPESEEVILAEKSFHDIFDLCDYTKSLLLKLKEDYDSFYGRLKKPNDEYSMKDMRKALYLIERIQQKKKWLSANGKKIAGVFGTDKLSSKTDWKQYIGVQKNTKATYEFESYQEYVSSKDWNGDFYELFDAIIQQEQPVHEKVILKRAANICNLKRVTPSLKKELNQFLGELKEEYEIVSGFVELKDKSTFMLRLPGSEKREITMISDHELKPGILEIVRKEQEVTLDQLSRIMCEQLGFQRRNQTFTTCMERLVKELKKDGLIIRKSAGWQLI